MAKQDDSVTVVRDDGKEFLIKRSMVAEHINRGNFKVKNKADEPTLLQRKNAVGFNFKKAEPTVPEEKPKEEVTVGNAGKPLDEWTVPELEAEATRLGLTFASNISRVKLLDLVTAKLQELVDTEMEDHEVTQDDLDTNPELADVGVKVGDVIRLPKAE